MTVQGKMQLAIENQQAGDLQQAEQICRMILTEHPDNTEALHLLGLLLYQTGRFDLAVHQFGRLLQISQNDPDAYNNLGLVRQATGQFDEAIACFKKAIELNPDDAHAYFNMGNALKERGQQDEAVSFFRKALQADPNFVHALNNLGVVLKEKGELDEAMANFQQALRLDPTLFQTCYNLGLGFQAKGKLDNAIGCFQNALELNPGYSEAYNSIGTCLKAKGELDKAINSFEKAIELNPSDADAWNNLGVSFQENGQNDKAIAAYQKVIRLNPDFAVAYNNLGISYYRKGQFSEAMDCYQKALKLNPELSEVFINLALVLKDKGQIDEAETCLKRAIHATPDSLSAYSNLLLTMQYNVKYDADTIYSEHVIFSDKFEKPLSSGIIPHTNKREPYRRLRIGYVSPDFRRHSVAYFIEPVLASHNKEMFEVYCYYNSSIRDEVTERIHGHVNQWRSIVGITDEEAAELIRKDEIDILIDLAGHTAGNRMLLFARKPAPVEASWIGYLATTGLSAMDYKIVDDYTDPLGETERFYTERLMQMPESFLCYQPDRGSPEVGPLPALSSGRITFGSFNNFAKMTPEVFSLWAKILDNVPDASLILKGIGFYDKTTCDYAMDMFAERGIGGERIVLQHPDPSPGHLASYNKIDIGLDTFPFNGAATTCEAIWMGVPVITLAGTAYHSRVGVSLLSNIGLSELVAGTKEEYISIAVNLARDLQRLESLRGNVRETMRRSPLCDAERFVADLEKCYRRMWKTWCKRYSPS
jgi:protein O-GlcNAc transferase